MNLVELGQVLEERRMAFGTPRAELARRVGVNPSYVWMIERARGRKGVEPSRPSKEVLKRWAKALGWDDKEDDPYTRQLLVLAGHLPDELDMPVTPPLSFGMALNYAEPPRLERERLVQEFRQLLNKADASSEHRWQGTVKLATLFLEGMGRLLDAPAVSPEQWSDTVGLFESYLEWLEFRLRG